MSSLPNRQSTDLSSSSSLYPPPISLFLTQSLLHVTLYTPRIHRVTRTTTPHHTTPRAHLRRTQEVPSSRDDISTTFPTHFFPSTQSIQNAACAQTDRLPLAR